MRQSLQQQSTQKYLFNEGQGPPKNPVPSATQGGVPPTAPGRIHHGKPISNGGVPILTSQAVDGMPGHHHVTAGTGASQMISAVGGVGASGGPTNGGNGGPGITNKILPHPDPQSLAIYDMMNLQQNTIANGQHRTGVSGLPAGAQAHGASVINTNRRDLKIPHVGMVAKNQTQRQQSIGNSLVKNLQANQVPIPGSYGLHQNAQSSYQQQYEDFASNHAIQSTSSGQFFRQQAQQQQQQPMNPLPSALSISNNPQQSVSIIGQSIGTNGTASQQNSVVGPDSLQMGHQYPLMNSGNTVALEANERHSGQTTLPTLTGTRSSFHARQRPPTLLPPSVLNNTNNNGANASESVQGNILAGISSLQQQAAQQMAGQGPPPSITGSNMKLRSIPRRQYKIMNNAHISQGGQYQIQPNQGGFEEDNNMSRQNRIASQLSGDNFINGGHQYMPLIRNSPIDLSRFDSQQQRVSSQLGFNGMQVTGQSAFNSQQSQNLMVPPQQPYQTQEENKQLSPLLQPIPLKSRLGSLTNPHSGQGVTMEPSPIPLITKITQAQMMSPGNFYPLPTQTSITSTLHYESHNEIAAIPSYQASSIPNNNQNSTRDIKIRKLNPAAHSKASKRFTLTGPQGFHPQSMSVTGQNPLNYLREIASQPSTMVKANSRRNIEYHNSLAEASAPQVQSQGIMINDQSVRKRLEEAVQKLESPQDIVGFSSHIATKNTFIGEGSKNQYQSQQKSLYSEPSENVTGGTTGITNQRIKAAFNTEERKRKFTTHSKFSNYSSKNHQHLTQQNLEHLRTASQLKGGTGFICIPNVIPYAPSPNMAPTNLSTQLLAADQVQPGPALTPKNTFNENQDNGKQQQRDDSLEDSQSNMILLLESYEDIRIVSQVATINIEQIEKELFSPIAKKKSFVAAAGEGSGHQTNDDIYIGSVDIHKNGQQSDNQMSSGEKQIIQEKAQFTGLEVSGFDCKPVSNEENSVKDPSPEKQQQNSAESFHLAPSTTKNLDVIEETPEDRSNHSHAQNLSKMRSNNTENLSSGQKDRFQPMGEYQRQLSLINKQSSHGLEGVMDLNDSMLNASFDGGSPVLSKFLRWRKNSEAFNKIYQKIFDSNLLKLNPANLELPQDLLSDVEKLSNISSMGNFGSLTVDEIKQCLHTLKKNQQIRERFQNPYLKKLRNRSFGGVSRSGEMNQTGHGGVSSSSVIEENIIVNGMSSMGSMSKSLSQAIINIKNYNNPQHNDKNTTPNHLVRNQKPILHVNGTTVNSQPVHFRPQFQAVAMQEKEPPKTILKSKNSSSPSNKVTVGIEDSGGNSLPEKHIISFESKSPSGSGGHPGQANNGNSLNTAEIKRLQYSQKHTSNKVMFALGGGTNDIVTGGTMKQQHKVKSLQHNKSQDHDASLSHKSDPLNQNRLNKLSSGSRTDSYYIPNSGESFHYQVQGFPNRVTHRQSKSLVRQNGPHQNPYNTNGDYLMPINGGSSGSGSKVFNDILNGSKAVLTERINAAIYEKVQGNLVKWRQLRKLGQGTSGEVFLAQDIAKSNALSPHLFVVKKLNVFSYNSGIDQNAIMKLKNEIEVYRKLNNDNIVKYIGSEIVSNQFCIYLEYMSGGSIQMIYQQQTSGQLPEETIKLYTRQILSGISYLHSNKVVHCDLKGANVLVDEATQRVKLTDFGCAKLFESSISHSDMNGAIRGSLAWMAPEVLMNKGIRRKADIWSLGCLVIEMAVGGNPWGSELFAGNNFQAMLKIVDPSSFPPIPQTLSTDCQDFIKRCLTRDYDLRPSAQELQTHSWIIDHSQPRYIDETKSHDSNPQSAL